MIYEIKRYNDNTGLVGIEFAGAVPVEVREGLIKAGWRYDWYRGAWIDLDVHEKWAIHALIDVLLGNVVPRHQMTKEEEKVLRAEYMALELAAEKNPDRWRKYYEEHIGGLVKLTDGSIVLIEKPRIETRFCYGESGYDMDEAEAAADRARTSEDHFRRENLRGLRNTIDVLLRSRNANAPFMNCVVVRPTHKKGLASFSLERAFDIYGNRNVEVSEEDRERLLDGYRKVYAAFEKRINAYLKRYGLSKVHSWTYWRDA